MIQVKRTWHVGGRSSLRVLPATETVPDAFTVAAIAAAAAQPRNLQLRSAAFAGRRAAVLPSPTLVDVQRGTDEVARSGVERVGYYGNASVQDEIKMQH